MASSNETLEVKIDSMKELLLDHIQESRNRLAERKKEMDHVYKKLSLHERWQNKAIGAMTILIFLSGGIYAYASYFVKEEIKNQTAGIVQAVITSKEMESLIRKYE